MFFKKTSTSILKQYLFKFQVMINIGNLLDACGISYTEKQLAKLNKLLKKLSLQQFNSNETTQQHDSISDSEDKSRNEGFDEETKLIPFQTAIYEIDFEPEPHYNNIVKAEILEESVIEIKEEFAFLETLENSEDVSDILHENYNLTLSIGN